MNAKKQNWSKFYETIPDISAHIFMLELISQRLIDEKQ